MAKKVVQIIEEVVNVDALIEEAMDIVIEEVIEVKEVKEAAPKAKVDIKPILTALPATVTPKDLDIMFGLNDGGKTVRRHLRKHFANGHDAKTTWGWVKDDQTLALIITHFAERYTAVEVKVAKAE